MKTFRKTKIVGVVVFSTVLGMSAATGAVAATAVKSPAQSVSAGVAQKTLACYKGSAVKKITAANPKCPTGWTTKKPATSVGAKALAFSSTYKGTISMLWSSSDVKVSSMTGTGTGSNFGLTKLNGTGNSSPTAQCAPIFGSGSLSGAGGTLQLNLDPVSKGCGADSGAPTTVDITGNAVVTGGTGKFAGAKGTLKFVGSFLIKSTAAGSNESDAFTVALTGTLNLK